MKNKLTLLKEYVDKQAYDHAIWFDAKYASEAYLQEEIRRVAWMIEGATMEQIQQEINRYDARL